MRWQLLCDKASLAILAVEEGAATGKRQLGVLALGAIVIPDAEGNARQGSFQLLTKVLTAAMSRAADPTSSIVYSMPRSTMLFNMALASG